MKLLLTSIQTAMALGFSLLVAAVFGTTYLAISIGVFALSILILFLRPQITINLLNALGTITAGLIIGVIWPSIPGILLWTSNERRKTPEVETSKT